MATICCRKVSKFIGGIDWIIEFGCVDSMTVFESGRQFFTVVGIEGIGIVICHERLSTLELWLDLLVVIISA